MPIIFLQLAGILGVALIGALAMHHLRQPLVVAYILTGIVVGPVLLNLVRTDDPIEAFGKIGVALLLFIVGLSLKPLMIREVGRVAALTGLGQIIVTTGLGYPIARWLGYEPLVALYLSVAFTFSSTIVVLQLLYTKEEQDTLYGRIATGFLLVQDFVAMVIFIFLTSAGETNGRPETLLALIGFKVVVIGAVGYLVSRGIVPRIDAYFARSREVLLLFALAMCFGLATIFSVLDFSLELGALVAGLLLAGSPYSREISARLSPLRDFFLLMFFVILGAQVTPATLVTAGPTIAAFSAFILIGNPVIVLVLMRRFRYTLATSFLAALTVAQISEFSLILLATGVSVGHLPATLLGPAAIIGLVTIFGSSYLIMHNRRLYRFLEPGLRKIFGPDATAEPTPPMPVAAEVILFGYHRLGSGIAEALKRLRLSFIIVDHNPDTIQTLMRHHVPAAYGSADDPVFLGTLPLRRCRTVISTIPEIAVNLVLVEHLHRLNSEAATICVAYHQHDARILYQAGATYVVVPPYLGRRYLIDLLERHRLDPEGYRAERVIHEQELAYQHDPSTIASPP